MCMSLGNSIIFPEMFFDPVARVLSRPTDHNWITGQTSVKINVISEELHISVFIGPRSDHSLPLAMFFSTARCSSIRNSLRGITHSITHSHILHIAVLPPAFMVFFISSYIDHSLWRLSLSRRNILLYLLLERSDPFAKCGGLLDQSSPDIYVRKNLFPFIFVSTHSNVSYVMYISNIALQQNQAGFVGYLCTCYWKSRSNVNLANFR